MNTSDSQSSLVPALFAAWQAFPTIGKTKEGQSGHRKFTYAPYDVVLDAVRPVLIANGLLLTQGTDGHNLITRLDHVSGEWREISMPMNAEHANMHSYGIEMTYRRRYSTQAMLGIVTEDDTDGLGDKSKRKGVDHTEPRKENGTIKLDGPQGVKGAVLSELPPLSAEDKEYYSELAYQISESLKNIGQDGAFDRAALENLENEEKLYLSTFLGSKENNALKREAMLRRGK